jgi:hypothetical protein
MKKRILKIGIGIILHNPGIVSSLFTVDFHKIYCSYFKEKLKESKKLYNNSKNEKIELLEKLV